MNALDAFGLITGLGGIVAIGVFVYCLLVLRKEATEEE